VQREQSPKNLGQHSCSLSASAISCEIDQAQNSVKSQDHSAKGFLTKREDQCLSIDCSELLEM
jgi:hypothetical protein